MALVYATFAQYTGVYSDKGITEDQINDTYLPLGALRVNEELGGAFTVPFSNNNSTARTLSIGFGHLEILTRTRENVDSRELRNYLMHRVKMLREGMAPMMTDSGDTLFSGSGGQSILSTTKGYKSIFDYRAPERQRVDPDQLDDFENRDV